MGLDGSEYSKHTSAIMSRQILQIILPTVSFVSFLAKSTHLGCQYCRSTSLFTGENETLME